MKDLILKNARVIDPARGIDSIGDIAVSNGVIIEAKDAKDPEVVDLSGKVLSPGFIDVHVHLRQPGNTAAETVATGSMAAAAGGFTSIVAMPNTNPAADTAGAIELLRRTAEKEAVVKVLPCGNMSKGGKGEEDIHRNTFLPH